MDTDRFEFWLRIYVNDVHLAEAYCNAPETFPNVDPDELRYQLERAWDHLVEMIPQSHIDAILAL